VAKILLSLHVLAAILAIGPVAVAASIFPRYLRLAAAQPADGSAANVPRALHRICRVYALLGIAVPFFGLATAGPLHVFGDAWVVVSIVLTAAAAALLAAVILPGQRRALAALPGTVPPETTRPVLSRVAARLAMTTGIFNLLWAAVVVLMIVRPGSTTGV
jgi:hypothetical protein